MTKIILDPRLKHNYASYYLYGILCLFDKKDIIYNVKPFAALSYKSRSDYNSGFAFIYKITILSIKSLLTLKMFLKYSMTDTIGAMCTEW